MDNADLDVVRQLATPKNRPQLDEGRKNRAVAMLRNGYTQAEVADMMGVSVSTLKRSLSEGDA
jgi:transposase